MKNKMNCNLQCFAFLLITVLFNSCNKENEYIQEPISGNAKNSMVKSNCLVELYDTSSNSNEAPGSGTGDLAEKEFRLNSHKYYRDCEGNILIIASAFARTKGHSGHVLPFDENCWAKAMVYLMKDGQIFNCFKEEVNSEVNFNTGAGFTWAQVEVKAYWSFHESELNGISVHAQGFVWGCFPPINKPYPQLIHWGEREGIEIQAAQIANMPIPALSKILQDGIPKICWSKIDDACYYEIWRRINDGAEVLVSTTTSTEFVDNESVQYLRNGARLSYRARTAIKNLKSCFSNPVQIMEIQKPTITISEQNCMPKIVWQPIVSANKYEVWRRVGNNNFELIAIVSSTFYTDYEVITQPIQQTWFYYKVKAKNDLMTSEFSNTLSIKGQIPL